MTALPTGILVSFGFDRAFGAKEDIDYMHESAYQLQTFLSWRTVFLLGV